MNLPWENDPFEPAFEYIKLASEESDSQKLARAYKTYLGGMCDLSLIVLAVHFNKKPFLACQSQETHGAHQHEEFAMQDEQLPNASGTTASSAAEETDMPVYVEDNRSSTSTGDPMDDFHTMIVGADNVGSGVSDAENPDRTKKKLDALMATSDETVSRMSRPGSGGRDRH